MRTLRLVAVLVVGAVVAAPAQLARVQPTERLLITPLAVANPADSALSVQATDAARERIGSLARYQLQVIPKEKICEALTASGFSCDKLLTPQEVRLLARTLQADAFTVGQLERQNQAAAADLRVIDVGGSGLAYMFSVQGNDGGSAKALGDAIAERLNRIIRASEDVRQCHEQRLRQQFSRALSSARKALEQDPNLTGAHTCIVLTFEAMRQPPDSLIAAAKRGLGGDSLNTTLLEMVARQYQVKGQQDSSLAYFVRWVGAEAENNRLRASVAIELIQAKRYEAAVALLRDGLARSPHDGAFIDLLERACTDSGDWTCVLDALARREAGDSALLRDTVHLKKAIGAAQQVSDTQAMYRYAKAGVAAYPRDVSFRNTLGSAHELRGQPDSAIAQYQEALRLEPNDLAITLRIAKAIIDHAQLDTSGIAGDTALKRQRLAAFGAQADSARPYIERTLTRGDSTLQFNATLLAFQAGSKLAQSQAYGTAYPWLEQVLERTAPRTPADTAGPRAQIYVNASFWWGIASVLTLGDAYTPMAQSRSCAQAKPVNDRVVATRAALARARHVHEQTVHQMLGFVERYERAMANVKRAFRCTNF